MPSHPYDAIRDQFWALLEEYEKAEEQLARCRRAESEAPPPAVSPGAFFTPGRPDPCAELANKVDELNEKLRAARQLYDEANMAMDRARAVAREAKEDLRNWEREEAERRWREEEAEWAAREAEWEAERARKEPPGRIHAPELDAQLPPRTDISWGWGHPDEARFIFRSLLSDPMLTDKAIQHIGANLLNKSPDEWSRALIQQEIDIARRDAAIRAQDDVRRRGELPPWP